MYNIPWLLTAGLSQGHAKGPEGRHDRAEEAARQRLLRLVEGQARRQGLLRKVADGRRRVRGPLCQVHLSPLVRSVFCPKKVDLTSGLTLDPGYNSV